LISLTLIVFSAKGTTADGLNLYITNTIPIAKDATAPTRKPIYRRVNEVYYDFISQWPSIKL